MSTEVLLALLNTPPRRCLGTAGAPPAGVEIKLTDANEICVRSPMGTIGYFENPQVTADSFDAEGFFKTGDQGEWYKAKDGVEYIRITGRIKDMIILHGDNYRGDENLWPETLEGIFKRATCIADCVIPPSCEHPERFHLVMLVALDEAAAAFTDAEIAAAIAEVGAAAGIQAHEYPLQFVRIPEGLTKENGFRNANHKLMRKKIDDHHKPRSTPPSPSTERRSTTWCLSKILSFELTPARARSVRHHLDLRVRLESADPVDHPVCRSGHLAPPRRLHLRDAAAPSSSPS